MSDFVEYDPYALPHDAIQEPPKTLWAALKMTGPGIILAGTIVGSGELLPRQRLPFFPFQPDAWLFAVFYVWLCGLLRQ